MNELLQAITQLLLALCVHMLFNAKARSYCKRRRGWGPGAYCRLAIMYISLSELGCYSTNISKSRKSRELAWDCLMGKRRRCANSQGTMRLLQGLKLSC